jgi:hypothetical protein
MKRKIGKENLRIMNDSEINGLSGLDTEHVDIQLEHGQLDK